MRLFICSLFVIASTSLFAQLVPRETLEEKILDAIQLATEEGVDISTVEVVETEEVINKEYLDPVQVVNEEGKKTITEVETSIIKRSTTTIHHKNHDNYLLGFELSRESIDIDSWAGVLEAALEIFAEDGTQEILDFTVILKSENGSKFKLFSNFAVTESVEFNDEDKAVCHYTIDFYRSDNYKFKGSVFVDSRATGERRSVPMPPVTWSAPCYE